MGHLSVLNHVRIILTLSFYFHEKNALIIENIYTVYNQGITVNDTVALSLRDVIFLRSLTV